MSAGEQRLPSLGVGEIERRGALPHAGIDVPLGELGQVRWIDPKHVGAQRRERAGTDRAGDDARQIEHADALARPRGVDARRRRKLRTGRQLVLDRHQRRRRNRTAGRMRIPLPSSAKCSGASPGRDHRALEVGGLGRQRRLLQPPDGAVLVAGDVDAQRAAERGGVVRIVAVRAQPTAVRAPDQPRQRRKARPPFAGHR